MTSRSFSTKRLILLFILLMSAGAGGFAFWKVKSAKDAEPKFTSIKAEKGDIRLFVQATGTVQPENRLVIKAPINGRIETVLIQEGVRVNRGQTLAYMSSVDRAALLDAARSKGPEEVKHWEEIYRPTPIVAPMAGVIIARNVEPGQTITSADSIFVMSDQLLVTAQVDETDIAKVSLKQGVSIVLDAYQGQRIIGSVHHIAFEAKTVNNVTVYDVQVVPLEVPAFMRSGMTASVKFLISERMNVVTIPAIAVKREGTVNRVLMPVADAKKGEPPVTRGIEIGLTDGRVVEVKSGLNEGDEILLEVLKLPEAKSNQSPFSPMGGGRRQQSGSGGRSPPHP